SRQPAVRRCPREGPPPVSRSSVISSNAHCGARRGSVQQGSAAPSLCEELVKKENTRRGTLLGMKLYTCHLADADGGGTSIIGILQPCSLRSATGKRATGECRSEPQRGNREESEHQARNSSRDETVHLPRCRRGRRRESDHRHACSTRSRNLLSPGGRHTRWRSRPYSSRYVQAGRSAHTPADSIRSAVRVRLAGG